MADATNPRYLAYARVHGHSPDAQLAADRLAWPGGCMTGFILWMKDRLAEYSREHPGAYGATGIQDHGHYDAWFSTLPVGRGVPV